MLLTALMTLHRPCST